MKKISFFVLMTALLTLASPATAQTDSLYVLREGFEAGIPATWSQENVSGSVNWAVETNGTYPTGASKGTGRAYFRNETTQTLGFVTRLITPAMDISQTYQPILVFDRAQAQRTGDVDLLRVYYRTAANKSWVFLREYASKVTNWKTDTIILPSPTATYQIAFEGTDRLGRGIVLDDVRVRPMPTCTTPFNITTTALGTNDVAFMYNGSLDADSFRIVLSTKLYTDAASAMGDSAIVKDTIVNGYSCSFEGLDAKTTYYVYIMSYCINEQSPWGVGSFTTLNIMKLPYSYGFNYNYTQGIIVQDPYWTYGTSLFNDNGRKLFTPYINTNVATSSWRYYSPDTTTSVWFNGALVGTLGRTSTTADNSIPAGDYAYIASPELDVESLAGVQASFWITAYTSGNTYYAEGLANGIIVGVMTDPIDWTTFVPVDTFYACYYEQFAYCVADFSSYTGTGKFIAFASNFQTLKNAVSLDKVSIYLPQVPTPSVKIREINPYKLIVDAGVTADSYNVKIASDKLASNAPIGLAPAAKDVLDTLVASTRVFAVPDSAFRGKFVNVYVQAVKNGVAGLWSEPVRVQVPYRVQMPATYSFEDADLHVMTDRGNRIWYSTAITYKLPMYVTVDPTFGYYQTAYEYQPTTDATKALIGDGSHVLYWLYGNGAVCFPYLDSLSNVLMSWTDACATSSYEGNYTLEIGVIESPDDFSTFTKLAEFTPQYGVLNKRLLSLKSYSGNGHYVAFRMRRNSTSNYAGIYVDAVTFTAITGCQKGEEFQVEPGVYEATISWLSLGATDWVVEYSTKANLANSFKVSHQASPMSDSTSVTINNLLGLTPYYYSVGTVCGSDTTWADTLYFETTCPPSVNVPYKEDFNKYEAKNSIYYGEQLLPDCWTVPQYYYYSSTSAFGYVPFISGTSTASYKYDGQFFILGSYYGSSSTNWQEPLGPLYFALPKLNAQIADLEMSFMMRNYSTTASYYATECDTLQVGIMTDPEDVTTFTPWYTYIIKAANASTTWQKIRMDFYGYNGPDGYVAVRKNTVSSNYHMIFIDDLEVKLQPSCLPIDEVEINHVDYNGPTLNISSRMGNTYEVAIHTVAKADSLIGKEDSTLVLNKVYNTTKIVATDSTIFAGNIYYAYVRTLCSDTDHSEWYGPIEFATPCDPFTPEAFNTAYATLTKAEQLICWSLGLRSGTTEIPQFKTNYGGSIYLYTNAASDGAFAVTPELKVDSIKNYSITFRAVTSSNTATYSKKLTVGVVTDPYDLSTFSPIQSFELNYVQATNAAQMGTANEYTVRLNNYSGDYNDEYGKRIMFLLEAPDVIGYASIQGFHVDSLTDCEKPIAVKAIAKAHTASVSWDGTSSSYHLLLSSVSIASKLTAGTYDATKIVLDTIVSAESLEIADLLASNTYYLNVQPMCQGEGGPWSYEYSFTTECEPFQLPFFEDFGNCTTGTGTTATLPNCWTKQHPKTTSNYPYINTQGNGDAKSLYMIYSTTYEAYAVLPRAGVPVNTMEMAFDYKGTSTYAAGALIGVAKYAEPVDSLVATFQAWDTITSLTTTWAEKIVNFSMYQGDGEFIVFKSFGASTYIDNIEIYELPTCMYPLSVSVGNVGSHQATVNWVGQGSNFDIRLAHGNDTTYFTANASPYSLTGLIPHTDYSVEVRQHCSADDQSRWIKATFTTDFGVPFSEDFAGSTFPPTGWTRYTGLLSDVLAGTALTSTTSGWTAITTNYGLQGKHPKLNIWSTSTKYWLVSPSIFCDNVAGLTLAFDAALTDNANGNSITSDANGPTGIDDRFIVIVSEDGGLTWDNAHMIVWSNDTATADYVYNDVPYDGIRYKLDFSRYAGKTVKIAFYGESTTSNAANDFHIGNVTLRQEFCDGPTDIVVVDSTITKTQALLTWSAVPADSAKYHLVVYNENDTVYNEIVSDTATLITSLSAGKKFTAAVTLKCPNGGESVPAYCEFATKIGVPYSESFEEGVPIGWNTYKQLINGVFAGAPLDSAYTPARTTGWIINPNPGYLFPKDHLICNIYGTTMRSWLVSPTIDVDSIDGLTLSFDVAYTKYSNANPPVSNPADGTRADDRFIVAVSEDDGATWSASNATIWDNTGENNVLNSITNEIKRLYVDMDKYQGKKIRIAFYAESTVTSNGDNDFHLANLMLKGEVVCYSPSALSVIPDSLDAHSVALKWKVKGSPSVEYQLKQDTTLIASGMTTDTLMSFSGLTPQTDYSFSVRSICDAEHVSDWVTTSFRTACLPAVVGSTASWPIASNVEGLISINSTSSANYGYPNCWDAGNEGSTSYSYIPYVYPTSTGSTENWGGINDQYGLRFYNYSTYRRAYAILPEIAGDLDTMQVTFWARAGMESNHSTGAYTDYGYKGVAYGHTILIGTVQGDDISTFQLMDTWTYPEHAKNVSNISTSPDPEGKNYWRFVSVPMRGAEGTRICFMLARVGDNYDYMYIDSIEVKACDCFRPTGMKVLNNLPDVTELTWNATADSFKVVVDDNVMVIDTNFIALANLQADSTYIVKIAAPCGEAWSDYSQLSFTTPKCGYAEADSLGRYSWKFDNMTTNVQRTAHSTSDQYVVPSCWISYAPGNPTGTNVQYEPSIYPSTATSNYICGYDGKFALRMSGYSSYRPARVILPAISGMDSMQLSFWARAGYETNATGSYTNYATSTYGHKLVVGTLTDPNDYSTFDTLIVYTAPEASSSLASDPAGAKYWRKVNVDLAGAKGKYIVFTLPKIGSSYDYMFLDNIQVKVNHCMSPDSVLIEDISTSSATIKWAGQAENYRVNLNGKDTIVNGKQLTLEGLESNTSYAVSITSVCDEDEESEPTVAGFKTSIGLPYHERFVGGVPDTWTRYSDLASAVLDKPQGALKTTVTGYWNANATTNGLPYDHVKGNIYGASWHYWLVSPAIFIDTLPNLTLSFDAALTHFGNGEHISSVAAGTTGYDDRFLVAISEDGGQTWLSANKTEWNNAGTGDHVYNDVPYNGERYYIDLTPFIGKTIKFGFYGESTVSNADNDMHIGNIAIQSENCKTVRRVAAEYSNGLVTMEWVAEVDSFQVQVASDASFTDSLILIDATVDTTAYSFAAELDQIYYYRVRTVCDSVNKGNWLTRNVSTPLSMRFFEGITEMATVPAGWTSTSNKLLNAAADGLGAPLAETSAYGWRYSLGGTGISTAHLRVNPYSTGATASMWIASPQIYLDAPDSIKLSFIYALTDNASAAAPTLNGNEQFAVVVSPDGGNTWDIANATVWAETTDANYSFAAIPTTATRQVIDLSRYAGQIIKVAFYAYGNSSTSNYMLHLDNIQVNTYEGILINQDLCQYEDFTYGDLTIDEERLPIGESTWYQFVPSLVDKKKDTYNTFHINVTEAVTTPLIDNVCYADTYQKYGFMINSILADGLYKLKLQGVNTCDSIVELNVSILSPAVASDSATICLGSSYNWNGKEYNIAGLFTDTLVSTVTGCDSIVTLRITAYEPSENDATVYLCPNGSLDFDGQIITETGQYTKTYTNAMGCDSIVIWNVVAAKAESSLTRHLLCAGETYTDASFVGIGVAGDYSVTVPSSVTGCDSIVNLHLVAVANGEATDQIYMSELPYELDGEALLPVGTAAGTYDFKVNTSCGEVTLHVVVKSGDGIDNVHFQDLSLAPNPTEVGKEVKILSAFNVGEQFTLQVFDATGATVYSQPVVATRAAITVPGMPAAGIYMVRLTGSNTTYQSKLIVR